MTDFRTPRNTTRAMQEDPAEGLLFLADSLSEGGPFAAIERQEAAGQREMVTSDVIPCDANGQEADLTALGFVLGPQVDGDPLFRQATLPPGWKREGSDHNMWSHIVDPLGRRRCSIFYKAAHYDRRADISVATVYGYVGGCLHEGTVPVLDDEWATRDAILAALSVVRAGHAERVERWTTHGDDDRVREYTECVQQCDELKARIEATSDEQTAPDETGAAHR